MSARALIKAMLPPVVISTMRRVFPHSHEPSLRFTGDYQSWAEAERASTGYDAPVILEKTRAAILKVRNGEAAYERDSVAFSEMELSFALLAGLLRAAADNRGQLNVLDFGGSLGSTYFQCRDFLSVVEALRWNIVEQPSHVRCGQSEFANEQLRFYETIAECLQHEQPNALLLSGVVQCLPAPYEFLDEVLKQKFPYVLVDRTPFLRGGGSRLTVEQVPAWIYPASYPSWFLSEPQFLACFEPRYKMLASFLALDRTQPEGGEADYKGFIFKLNDRES